MEFSEAQREDLQQRIVLTLLGCYEKGMIDENEIPLVADFVLDNMYKVHTYNEVMEFLRVLSSKWNIFTHLLVLKSGELKEKTDQEVAEGVLLLAKSGKIDNAIALAQTATRTGVDLPTASTNPSDMSVNSESVVNQSPAQVKASPSIEPSSQSAVPGASSVPEQPLPSAQVNT